MIPRRITAGDDRRCGALQGKVEERVARGGRIAVATLQQLLAHAVRHRTAHGCLRERSAHWEPPQGYAGGKANANEVVSIDDQLRPVKATGDGGEKLGELVGADDFVGFDDRGECLQSFAEGARLDYLTERPRIGFHVAAAHQSENVRGIWGEAAAVGRSYESAIESMVDAIRDVGAVVAG